MTDRLPAMVEFLARRISEMAADGRRPGTNPAADLEASLRRRWPNLTPFEQGAATLGLANHLSAAETAARPANDQR